MTIEIRHLHGFLAVVDAGTFSAAARRLHVGQPALSRTVAQLERALSVTLIDRSTHHCTPTDAGVRFAAAARDAVLAFEDALATATGRHRALRLGHSWAAGQYLARIVRSWNGTDRPCELTVVNVDDRSAGLERRDVDAAILRGTVDARVYSTTILDEEPRVAVLPVDHPHARAASVRLADLAGGRLIATHVGLTTPLLWPAGQRPKTAKTVKGLEDWLVAIAAGTGFGVSVASTATLYPHPEVRYVPLADAPPVPVLLAYPRRNPHPGCGLLSEVAARAQQRGHARR